MIKYIENQMYTYLWDGKPEKVKRKTLIQNYEKVDLKMIDIENFIQAQKITWIKRMLDSNNKTVLNEIYQQRLNKFGRALYYSSVIKVKNSFLQTYS